MNLALFSHDGVEEHALGLGRGHAFTNSGFAVRVQPHTSITNFHFGANLQRLIPLVRRPDEDHVRRRRSRLPRRHERLILHIRVVDTAPRFDSSVSSLRSL